MTQEDRYRKQAKDLVLRIDKARELFAFHKPSIGYVGEKLIRQALKKMLPHDYDECQGFISCKRKDDSLEEPSGQCDIIIFRKEEGAVLYSIGDLKIVNADSVVSVIEVKSSINKKSFATTLQAFEKLKKLRVRYKFIFVYDSLSPNCLSKWFYKYRYSQEIILDTQIYDWPDEEWLPTAILSLESHRYYVLNHLQDDNDDWVGYASYIISDSQNKKVSCLQEFFATVVNSIGGNFEIDQNDYSIREGILMWQM